MTWSLIAEYISNNHATSPSDLLSTLESKFNAFNIDLAAWRWTGEVWADRPWTIELKWISTSGAVVQASAKARTLDEALGAAWGQLASHLPNKGE
jgi:hypothetical protein